MNFTEMIKSRARQSQKIIVLPETGDIRTIMAASKILSEKIAKLVLVGNKDKIIKDSKGFDLSGAIIIDPVNYERSEEFVNTLFELRKAKGMTMDEANKLIYKNELYFGIMLVKTGIADGMVAGAVNSTPDVLSPCVRVLKTNPASKLISAFFVMCVPNCEMGYNGTFIFADCGLNQNPDSEKLAHIAIDSAKSFKQLVGADPVVAFLSNSTLGSTKHEEIDKVVKAVEIAKKLSPDIILDGEFQVDAAIVPSVGEKKAPGNIAAGRANVLIFPDLQAGNIGYKLTERLARAHAYGPVTQGIAKPVNDLSRGCSADDIVGVVAITAVQAQSI